MNFTTNTSSSDNHVEIETGIKASLPVLCQESFGSEVVDVTWGNL